MKIVYTVHGYLHRWPPAGRRERVVQRMEKWEAGRTDLTLFQSNEDLEEALARGYGGTPTYLGNGVEDRWFEEPLPDRKGGQLSLLFVGRIVKEKGILDLLEAVAQTPGVFLHIAGDTLSSDRDGVSRAARALVNDRLADRVQFHGVLGRKTSKDCMERLKECVYRATAKACLGV